MGVCLIELDPCQASEQHRCVVQHGSHQIPATIVGEAARVKDLLGKSFSAEYEIDGITEVEINLPIVNESSGIYRDGSGVVIDGAIHQIHETGDDNFLFDIYIMNGPEFAIVTTEQLNGLSPGINSRIRLIANELMVYPTFT